MRKTLVASLVVLALVARPAHAQAPAGSRDFVSENIKPLGDGAAPVTSSHDWKPSVESLAQAKWTKGGFASKRKSGAKPGAKGTKPRANTPPRKPPVKKP